MCAYLKAYLSGKKNLNKRHNLHMFMAEPQAKKKMKRNVEKEMKTTMAKWANKMTYLFFGDLKKKKSNRTIQKGIEIEEKTFLPTVSI